MSLSAIPLPIRIVAGVLLVFLLFRLIGGHGELLLILAGILWAVLLVALLYESGPLARLGGLPGAGQMLDWVTNRASAPPPSSGAAIPGRSSPPNQSRGGLNDEDRARLLAEAHATLEQIVGQEEARDLIETRLFEPARRASTAEAPAFGTRAPAVVVAISGQRGLGAEEIARAVAKGYVGHGALRRAHVVALRSHDLRTGASQVETVTAKAEEAIGGTLLLEDADWMLDPDPYGGPTAPGVEAGLAIFDVAQRHPQSFLIVATFAEGTDNRLRNDSGHDRWLGRLTVHNIRLKPLDDVDLLFVLRRELEAIGCPLDAAANRAARTLLRDVREHRGPDFDNAEACRRIAEQLSAAATEMALEDGRHLTGEPGAPRSISQDHVGRVRDTWE